MCIPEAADVEHLNQNHMCDHIMHLACGYDPMQNAFRKSDLMFVVAGPPLFTILNNCYMGPIRALALAHTGLRKFN
jgi:hypothetical protein